MRAGSPGPEICIVDDDASVREVLADLFSMEGYRVRTFSHGEKAWQAITSGARPAAIVLDLWLADMSGRQFLARLRTSSHSAIPVVVVSGSGFNERVDCGADASFRKPVEANELVRTVDRLVAHVEAAEMIAPGVRQEAAPPRGSRMPWSDGNSEPGASMPWRSRENSRKGSKDWPL